MRNIIFIGVFVFNLSNAFADGVLPLHVEKRKNVLSDGQNISKGKKSAKIYVIDNLNLSKKELETLIAKAHSGDMWAANDLGMYYDVAPKCFTKAIY